MERPNHLNVGDKSASSKAGSIAIVAGIHVAVIFGLIAALNQGALMKQLQEIKATVDTPTEGVTMERVNLRSFSRQSINGSTASSPCAMSARTAAAWAKSIAPLLIIG